MISNLCRGLSGKESACRAEDLGSIPGPGRSLEGGHGNSLQYSCLEKPHGWRSLACYSPWGCKESDMTEQLSTAQHNLPRWLSGKESACQCRRHRRCRFDLWIGNIPWSRKWQPTPVFLPGKFQKDRRNLVGYSPWGCKESATEHAHTTTPNPCQMAWFCITPGNSLCLHFKEMNQEFLGQ